MSVFINYFKERRIESCAVIKGEVLEKIRRFVGARDFDVGKILIVWLRKCRQQSIVGGRFGGIVGKANRRDEDNREAQTTSARLLKPEINIIHICFYQFHILRARFGDGAWRERVINRANNGFLHYWTSPDLFLSEKQIKVDGPRGVRGKEDARHVGADCLLCFWRNR